MAFCKNRGSKIKHKITYTTAKIVTTFKEIKFHYLLILGGKESKNRQLTPDIRWAQMFICLMSQELIHLVPCVSVTCFWWSQRQLIFNNDLNYFLTEIISWNIFDRDVIWICYKTIFQVTTKWYLLWVQCEGILSFYLFAAQYCFADSRSNGVQESTTNPW